jgi:hypothetical protein
MAGALGRLAGTVGAATTEFAGGTGAGTGNTDDDDDDDGCADRDWNMTWRRGNRL